MNVYINIHFKLLIFHFPHHPLTAVLQTSTTHSLLFKEGELEVHQSLFNHSILHLIINSTITIVDSSSQLILVHPLSHYYCPCSYYCCCDKIENGHQSHKQQVVINIHHVRTLSNCHRHLLPSDRDQ